MSEPKLVTERKNHSINQSVGVADLPKNLSQKTVNHFNAQNIKNKSMGSARDAIANKLSATSASNNGSYSKCSPVSSNPCIVTGGYIDKRAYSGSGMAGWPQAGLAGNFVNNTNTEQRVEFAKDYLPRVGVGITAMVATMLAPQAVPYIAEYAGASYLSVNSASYAATGLLADEIILYSAGGVTAYFTPASPPSNPIEAIGLGASIATDALK